jgi:3'-phosphoadenosine 5'-phosphosulfate sulfotransferase
MGEKKVIVRVYINHISQHGPGRSYTRVYDQETDSRTLFNWGEECRKDAEDKMKSGPGSMALNSIELALED